MEVPTTGASSQPDTTPANIGADALTQDGEVTLQITGDKQQGRKNGYSILLQGEIQASSILSSNDPEETIMLLENNTRLLSGSVHGETAGFVLDGKIVAAEFDDPEPTVKLGGAIIDSKRWPTVKEYTGYGPDRESVEDPFSTNEEVGTPPSDPLNADGYTVELDATELDNAKAYCFDVDGEIISHPDSATVSDQEDRVYGYLCPEWSAKIEVRGTITRIDTAEGIDFTVRARDKSRKTLAD